MGTFWVLAVGAGLGIVLLLTLCCSLFRWPQSGFSASLTICCMFHTQIESLNLEPVFLLCLLSFLSSLKYKYVSLHSSTAQMSGSECALGVPSCTGVLLSEEFVTKKG